jgi:hypothetical protein
MMRCAARHTSDVRDHPTPLEVDGFDLGPPHAGAHTDQLPPQRLGDVCDADIAGDDPRDHGRGCRSASSRLS